MYSRKLTIGFLGLPPSWEEALKTTPSQPSFTHRFLRLSGPDDEAVAEADLIIAALSEDEARQGMGMLEAESKEGCGIVLVGGAELFSELGDATAAVLDLWPESETVEEVRFRFRRWLETQKRAADAWQTEQYLDAVIDSNPSLVWFKTSDGVHEKVNASFCETVGKTKDQVQGQRHAYIWDVEEDDPACIESERLVMESGKTCVSEEVVQAGGDTKLLTTYKTPLYDFDGSVMGTVGVAIDTTQERVYENDLLEKNQTLETIFTTMDCGVLTHSIDGSRILGVNRKALDILGYESEEAMMEDGFSMVAMTVLPEDQEKLRAQISSLHSVGDSVSTQYRVLHEDGELIHVMGNIKLIERDGERFYQRFLLDVTEQKLQEEQKDRRQRDLVQALSKDYVVVCAFSLETGAGEILRAETPNDSVLASIFTEPVSIPETIDLYIDSRVLDDEREMLRQALSVDNIIEELQCKDRFDRLYRTSRDGASSYRQATVVRVGTDKTQNAVVIGFRNVDQQIRDELEQKTLLEEALGVANKANEAKSAFLLNMSHDIRTPMNAIVGFTTLATNRLDDKEQVADYLAKIRSSSNHLLNLINDILSMSRIEQGKVSLEEDRCNLHTMLMELNNMLQSEAKAKGLTLEVDASKVTDADVVCDWLKVNQILLNLLGNSIKFTPSGGRVDVTVEELPGAHQDYAGYRFVVEDTGIGMAKDFIEHIFDPFERERTQTISGIQGSGLGMAIVKNLVQMMNGSIEVESEPGEGTRFTLTLPFKVAEGEDATPSAPSGSATAFDPERAQNCRILLVDDNLLNLELAEELLSDAGFPVECAGDGQVALDMLKGSEPDYYSVVLMDIQMPIMNGYEAAQAIRSLDDPVRASIPILAVTADAFDEDRQKALDAGMNGHVAKPIEVSHLFEVLESVLN